MPRRRVNAPQRRRDIIGGWQRHYDIPDETAAKMLGLGRTAFYERKKRDNWRLEELHLAIRAFHIPAEEALEILTVGCYPLEQFMEKEKRKKYGTK